MRIFSPELHASAAANLLSICFADSPLLTFAIPNRAKRIHAAREIFKRKLASHGTAFSGHVVDGGEVGVALWYSPDFEQNTDPAWLVRQGILRAPFVLGMNGFIRLARNSSFKKSFLKRILNGEKAWTLDLLAVHPNQRKKGVATGLVRTKLALLDAKKEASLVITQDERVESLYRRLGYSCISADRAEPTAPLTKIWRRAYLPRHRT